MIYSFQKKNIYYKFNNKSTNVVNVFLHGWARSCKDFKFVAKNFANQSCLIVDLPPFGKSGMPLNWSLFTYVNMLKCLFRKLNIEKVNIIGHSFGGRLAICLASENIQLVNKLVLVSSAGMKKRKTVRSAIIKIKIRILKFFKKDISKYWSKDYAKLDENMKKTFKLIINTHLEDFCKLIRCKTLIIFGENDTETPLYMAKRFNRLIANSRLVVLKNTGHFCFLESEIKFCDEVKSFLEEGDLCL